MKVTITHTCGHTHTYNLYGKYTERDRKEQWLAEQVCPECRRAAELADADANAEAAGRPELTGSEKQIDWAKTIREKAVADINKRPADAQNDVATAIYSRLREEFNHDEAKIESRGKEIADKLGEDKQAAIVALLMETVNDVTAAKDWIDSRSDSVAMLADLVAVKLIGADVDKTPETLQPSQFGKCKNGSYYIKTHGFAESTDQTVKTELAFIAADDVTANEDGTIAVAKDVLQKALDKANAKTSANYGTFCNVYVNKPTAK